MAHQVAVAKAPAKRPFKQALSKEEVAQQQQSGNIPPDRLGDAIAQMFAKFDKDNNGFVTLDELKQGLAGWGVVISLEAGDILKKLFKNVNNANRAEFETIMRFFLKIRSSFTKYDVDKSNTLSKTELPKILAEFDFKFQAQVLQKFLSFFDTDKSGELDWQEVVELVLYVYYLNVLFSEEDKDKSGALNPSELQALLRALNFCVTVKETEVFLRNLSPEKQKNLDFSSFVELLFDMKQNVHTIREKAQEEREAGRVKRTHNDLGKRKMYQGDGYDKELQEHNQKVEKLRQQLRSAKKKYEDPEFPCDVKYHFPTNTDARGSVQKWRRMSEFENAALFKNGIDQGDVLQGSLGDCWFLSSLCVLAGQGTGILEDLFLNCDAETGTVNCRIFKNGKWHFVLVDDRIPCGYSGNPSFGKCRDDTELWVPLLEKAYAKLHGTFEAIEAGSITEGLVDLTGEVSEMAEIKNSDQVWKLIQNNIKEGYLMGCAAHASGASVEQETPLGILMLHAYGILKAVEAQGHKLLQIRNPWGHHEWKGRWSDGAKEWTQSLIKQLNVTFEDDGTFWMEFCDFCENFNKLYVLRILTDDIGDVWTRKNFSGEWKGESAGGCLNNQTSWMKNPQFSVKTSKDTKVFVSVRQHDQRMIVQKAPEYEALGFAILLKGDDSDKKKERISGKSDLVCMSPFVGSREVSLEFEAKAGVTYVVLPSHFDAHKEGKFFLSMFSLDHNAVMKPLGGSGSATNDSVDLPMPGRPPHSSGGGSHPDSNKRSELPPKGSSSSNDKILSLKGKWVNGKNSGGCPMTISWRKSPQYILEVASKSKVEITLTQEKSPTDGKFQHIGYLVFKAELPTKKRRMNTRDMVYQSQFINSEVVNGTIDLDAGTYNITACTYHPNMEASYTLSVSGPSLSNSREFYELSADSDWKSSEASGSWANGRDGGCSNTVSTWTQNPHFVINCSAQQHVKIILEGEADIPIGFYLFGTKDGRTPDEQIAVSPFVRGLSLGCVTTFKDFADLKPGKYILRASTLEPKLHGNFKVLVLAEKSACPINSI